MLTFALNSANAQEVVANSYLVTYRADATRVARSSVSTIKAQLVERGLGERVAELRQVNAIGAFSAAGVANLERYGTKHVDFCNALMQTRDDVASCEPNWVWHASDLPNDPRYQSLWGLAGANGISAEQAWSITHGSENVVAAVIDTGIDYTHPDLVSNLWINPNEIAANGIDDDGNGVVDDVYGANFSNNGRGKGDPFDDNSHGTHVAGTIGATGNNGVGVVGVNWHVKLLSLKFLNASGSGSTDAAVLAINYLIDLKNRGVNVRVVNNSWGGGGDSPALKAAIMRADAAGILFTVAAGNSGLNVEETPQYPAAYTVPNMLKVAALDREGNLAYFSNYGARLVDIAAPGVDIVSTVPGNQYASYSGTSMATPHVTGVAALYLSRFPDASVSQVKEAIINGGRDLSSLVGLVGSARTLDGYRAVSRVSSPVAPPTVECPYEIGESDIGIDTAADSARPLITSDEDDFTRVALPFAFPFEGKYRTSMVLSPNGVAYFGAAPSLWDNKSQSSAPVESIAALHTDLYPDPTVASGLGVRVATSSAKVTVSWRARVYSRQAENEQVVARLSLYPSGIIELSYSINSPGLETALASARIGVRGSTASSASSYIGSARNGLKLRMIPGCSAQEAVGTRVETISAIGFVNKRAVRAAARAGSSLVLRGRVSGLGTVRLIGRIDGRRCALTPEFAVAELRLKRFGRIPSGLVAKRISLSLVGDDGAARTAGVRIQGNKQTSPARRAKSTSLACEEMMRSF